MPRHTRSAAVSSVTVALFQAFTDSTRALAMAYVYRIECEDNHQYFFGSLVHPTDAEKMTNEDLRAMIPKSRRPRWIACVAQINGNANAKPEA